MGMCRLKIKCHVVALLSAGVVGFALVSGGGCAATAVPFPVRALDADEAYRRSQMVFEEAVFYKPDESHVEPLRPEMAPLMVLEVGNGSRPTAKMSGLGFVFTGADDMLRVDDAQPVVYAALGSSFVGGAVRSQTVVAWCQEVAISEDAYEVVCRGVRVTHGDNGYPLTWEVLDPKRLGCVIYVSETVESLSRTSYGAPVAGRRHSVERAVEDELGAVVPRVLSDGPMPMGPFVYLDAARGDVTAVLCRCMASQVDRFTETRQYRVLPLVELGGLGRALTEDETSLAARLRWPDGIE